MLMQSFISVLLLTTSGCSLATSASMTQPTPQIMSNPTVTKATNKMKSLDAYQWKNRLVLVFAPSENNAAYQQQMQLFQGQQASFAERNLLLIELLTDGTSRVGGESVDAKEAAQIRERFNVSPEQFSVVLVGKDGTAKRREQSPVSSKVIFETIDAMPMRRQEMRDGSS